MSESEERIKRAVVLGNILFENPNDEQAKTLLRELYNGCSKEEQSRLNSMGIHPEVVLKLKELLREKQKRK